MKEFELKYGCNPNQKPPAFMSNGGDLPIQILNGRPGYINFLDALNAWQLVKELKAATGMAAAFFQARQPHLRRRGPAPAGEAEAGLLCGRRAGTGRFPPWPAPTPVPEARTGCPPLAIMWRLSDVCDVTTAKLIAREVSGGSSPPATTRRPWPS